MLMCLLMVHKMQRLLGVPSFHVRIFRLRLCNVPMLTDFLDTERDLVLSPSDCSIVARSSIRCKTFCLDVGWS